MIENLTLVVFLQQAFTSLLSAVPSRCMATLFELLVGILQVKSPHVSSVIFYLGSECHWTTYYWFIRKAKWSWLYLLRAWVKLSLRFSDDSLVVVAIDDFLNQRSSEKAPGVAFHHDHAKKHNRPKHIWGQCWVNLSRIVQKGNRLGAIPLINRLSRVCGNRSKLKTAVLLCWIVFPFFEDRTIRLLVDAWYMKGPLILPLLGEFANLEIIGQVRRDTALFHPPTAEEQKPRGRKRIYGKRVKFDDLPELTEELKLYGKKQLVRYRTCLCLARFLKGLGVRIVWVLLEGATKWRLLLSTNPNRSAVEIMKAYDPRWKVEPSYNDFKNRFGLLQAWQQSRQALARWVALLTIGYGINKLIAILQPQETEKVAPDIPWRKNKPLTAGWIMLGMVRLFRHFRLNPESRQNVGQNHEQIVKELVKNAFNQLE